MRASVRLAGLSGCLCAEPFARDPPLSTVSLHLPHLLPPDPTYLTLYPTSLSSQISCSTSDSQHEDPLDLADVGGAQDVRRTPFRLGPFDPLLPVSVRDARPSQRRPFLPSSNCFVYGRLHLARSSARSVGRSQHSLRLTGTNHHASCRRSLVKLDLAQEA